MAYLPSNPQEQKEDEDDKTQAQGGQQPPVLGAPSAAAAQTSGQTADQTGGGKAAEKQPSRSGSFTNLQNYVTANTGNDTKMGQAVGGVVGDRAGEATTGLGDWKTNTASKINDNTTKLDDGFTNNLRTNAAGVSQDEFNKYANANYDNTSGPKTAQEADGFQGVSDQFGKVKNLVASSQGGLTGRGTLLNEAYDRPNYNSGERNLDSFILGTGEGGKQELANINSNYGDFDKNLTAGVTDVDNQIGTARGTTAATAKRTGEIARETLGGYDTDITNAGNTATAANTAATAKQAEVVAQAGAQDFGSRSQAYQTLGLDPQQIEAMEYVFQNGGDTSRALGEIGAVQAGDYLGTGVAQNYGAIRGLLGETPVENPGMLQASGNLGRLAPSVNKDMMGSIQELSTLGKQLDGAKSASDAETDRMRQTFINNPAALAAAMNVDPALMQSGAAEGVDHKKFITENAGSGHRDATKFNQLSALLGGKGMSNTYDTRMLGFDTAGYQKAVATAKAERVAREESEAAFKNTVMMPGQLYDFENQGPATMAAVADPNKPQIVQDDWIKNHNIYDSGIR